MLFIALLQKHNGEQKKPPKPQKTRRVHFTYYVYSSAIALQFTTATTR